MRSESEIRWVRVKNNVGQRTAVSDWHAIVPGRGVNGPPPGVACGMALTGSRQFEPHSGIFHQAGRKCADCMHAAREYIDRIDRSPGPRPPEKPIVKYAAPGSSDDIQ